MAKEKSDILSRDGNHLALMYDAHDGIEIDKSLLKYSSIKQEVEEFNKVHRKNSNIIDSTPVNQDVEVETLVASFGEQESIKKLTTQYELIKDSDVHTLNVYVNEYIFKDVFSNFNEYSTTPFFFTAEGGGDEKSEEKKSFFNKLCDLFNFKSKEAKEEAENTRTIDVLQFFSDVKGLTKESKDKYINRLTGYIVALKNCDITGQEALKEKLLRDMVVNKYESVLYANDFYYVVTEDQIVDFVKKTEHGVRLTYIKNFMRALPQDVLDKIAEANKLQIFDNYAILHYDPELGSYAETIEETKKRRDPILFGLIRGSNKLYYITDWADEYCDLTLDQFVETLQINKDELKMQDKL